MCVCVCQTAACRTAERRAPAAVAGRTALHSLHRARGLAMAQQANQRWGLALAAAAGASGATAAVLGKMATDERLARAVCHVAGHTSDACGPSSDRAALVLLVRVLSFLLTFAPNALMWAAYTRSMAHVSSVTASVTSTTASILAAAVWGVLVFGESLSVRWLCGAVLICLGALVAVDASAPAGGGARDKGD